VAAWQNARRGLRGGGPSCGREADRSSRKRTGS